MYMFFYMYVYYKLIVSVENWFTVSQIIAFEKSI